MIDIYVPQPFFTFLSLKLTDRVALPLTDLRPENLEPGTDVRVHPLPLRFSSPRWFGEHQVRTAPGVLPVLHCPDGVVQPLVERPFIRRVMAIEDSILLDPPRLNAMVDIPIPNGWVIQFDEFERNHVSAKLGMEVVTSTMLPPKTMAFIHPHASPLWPPADLNELQDEARATAAYDRMRQKINDDVLRSLSLPQEVTDPAAADLFRGDILEGDVIRLELTVDGDVFSMVVIAAEDDRDSVFDSLPEGSLKVARVERPEPKKVWPPS